MEDSGKSASKVRWVLGAMGLGTLASIGSALAMPGKTGLTVALIILVFLLLLNGGFLLFQRWKQKQRRKGIEQGLSQEAARTPVQIKDAQRQAELDSLRKRFLEGIQVYRSRGKDIYSVPWFVIIGESGSGKTEAIRHSNLDLAAGLNDPLQGTGGTINMDWWFTNHGVVLDTAGSMVFPEMGGDSAGSSQWEEFLNLLRKHRPNCPINGLLLVLSVDSFISDSAPKIAEKAGRIARQLDLIQRTLDVRFPVSVIVTKCDKLTGFREFFEKLDDLDLQAQMVGWSNPDPLDKEFRPDLVDQYLEQVVQRLRRRRLGLLRDPLPTRGPRARRTDEVDALYALPKSLSLIAPRLRRYLETIFVAGTFTTKPVFLRGIYFTSAMQVGSDLDEAVWKALGRSDDITGLARTFDQLVAEAQAAEKKLEWERAFQCYSAALRVQPGNPECKQKVDEVQKKVSAGRPFFLRDLFLEKVFKERGLVTRATNTQRLLRQRKLAIIGVSSACLLLFLLFAFLGWSKLKTHITGQMHDWQTAAAVERWETNQSPHVWQPIVASGTNEIYYYQGETQYVRFNDSSRDTNLAGFHQRLRRDADEKLKVSWVFFPATWFGSVSVSAREEAQRVVFERSVIRPLLDDTRRKMIRDNPPDGAERKSDPFQEEALLALIRLENDLAMGRRTTLATNADLAVTNLHPFMRYLTETTQLATDVNLAQVLVQTYQDWPPKMALRPTAGETLRTNVAIDYGLNRFFTNTLRANVKQAERVKALKNVRHWISEFEREERRWHKDAPKPVTLTSDHLQNLEAAKRGLDLAITDAGKLDLLLREDTFEANLAHLRATNAVIGSNAVARVRAAMVGSTNRLAQEIVKKLEGFQQELAIRATLPPELAGQPGELDANYLNFWIDKKTRYYQLRFQVYTQAYYLKQPLVYNLNEELGSQWRILTNFDYQVSSLNKKSDPDYYKGGYGEELRSTRDYLVNAGRTNIAGFVNEYERYVIASLARSDFPVLSDGQKSMSLDAVKSLHEVVSRANADLSAATSQGDWQDMLKPLATRVNKCQRILTFLVDTNGLPRNYSVEVDKFPAQARYRALAISEDGRREAVELTIQSQHFGPFKLDGRLSLVLKEIRTDPDTKALPWNIDEWAALRLLKSARPAEADPNSTNWVVRFQMGGETNRLHLLFTQPPPADWLKPRSP